MPFHKITQGFSAPTPVVESVIPNPKLKLLDQMREVMRLEHYATTMMYTHVLKVGASGTKSPLDCV